MMLCTTLKRKIAYSKELIERSSTAQDLCIARTIRKDTLGRICGVGCVNILA